MSDLYILRIGPPILLQQIQADRPWEYTNRLQIYKCRSWERGRAVSFLGIFFRIFDSVFAVHLSHLTHGYNQRRCRLSGYSCPSTEGVLT